MIAAHNSKITRSAQVAKGAFAPVFALPTPWGPDVRQFGRFKWRTPERAADKLPCGQLRVIQNVMRHFLKYEIRDE